MASVKRSYFVIGVLVCTLGAICFSTKAILVKICYRDTEVDAVTLLALRMLFSLPFFVISAWTVSRKSENIRFTGKQWFYVAVIGCLGHYVSSLLDFLGLQYISAGTERLILFIYPTIVLMISALVFKVWLKRQQWIAVIITYCGLLFAFYAEARLNESAGGNFLLGTSLIFLCAITFAIYVVGSGRLIPVIGAAKFNSYAMSFASLAVLINFAIVGEQSLLDLPSEVYLYSILMAILSTVIPSYLVAEGIKRVGSSNAAIVSSIGPVSTIIQANIFLGEPVLAAQIAGTILILTGVIIIGRSK